VDRGPWFVTLSPICAWSATKRGVESIVHVVSGLLRLGVGVLRFWVFAELATQTSIQGFRTVRFAPLGRSDPRWSRLMAAWLAIYT
jgi:hypothetical protein